MNRTRRLAATGILAATLTLGAGAAVLATSDAGAWSHCGTPQAETDCTTTTMKTDPTTTTTVPPVTTTTTVPPPVIPPKPPTPVPVPPRTAG